MRFTSSKLLLLALGVTVTIFLGSASLNGDTTDPATLHIGGGAGTPCATGCAGEPNLISGNNLDIYQTSGGADPIPAPQLLILGVPNDTTNLFGTDPITGVTYINPYPGGATTSGSSGSSFFAGAMGPSENVYDFLGLTANNSNSFTNWAAADLAINGITANNFGIYELSLNGGILGPKGLIDVLFTSGALPLGTFAVAYGTAGDQSFSTPFTEAGLTTTTTTNVPEPGTLLLLGTGALVLVRMKLKRGTQLAGL
jgi:hypothetical protein